MNDAVRQHLIAGERAGLRYALGLPRQAPVNLAGGSLGQRAGSSLEFKDHRGYEPGDDLRHIDWNAYARTDQLSVKLFREEVNPHVDILVDVSRSMALEDSRKAEATLGLAAFFAAAARNAGYSHTAWGLGEEIRQIPNSSSSPTLWEPLDFAYCGSLTEGFTRSLPRWRPRGIRILLSDLLWLGDPLTVLRPLAERAAVAVVAQVLAEADVDPPPAGNLRLVDSETGQIREIYVDVSAVRRYKNTLVRHQENWHQACRQSGAIFTDLVAERVLRDWKLDELVAAEVLTVV
jgi:uncharacterized protein (DUF58 family)